MKSLKEQQETIRMSLRLPARLHAELVQAATYNGRFLNDEVLERIKAGPVIDLLQAMARENAELKAMIKEMHSIATGK